MSTIITDGTGTGKVAKVNSKNRLNVNAITLSDIGGAALEGKAFWIASTPITLTSDSKSATFYLKNTGIEDMFVTRLFISAQASTGGAGALATEVVRNPTEGTIVSGGTTVNEVNLNFGSVKVLPATILQGVEGSTFTDGASLSDIYSAPTIPAVFDIQAMLTPGTSVGLNVTPPTGNTSMDVVVGLNIHLDGFGE